MIFDEILANKRVVVVCGSGGVGKTTTSAALGLYAAQAGKRTLVLTIDPARRLANALGLESFGNVARQVPLEALNVQAGGSLSAMMLDMKQTFDDMVAEHVGSADEQRRLRENRLYRSMSQALAGIQEYMAVAKLYDVLSKNEYDLVVLDTPPTSHALDFLDAPARFMDFLDHDALQWLLKSTSSAGKMSFRLLDIGSSYIMKSLGRIAGIDVLREIGEFVSSFYPLFLGFRDRAEKINQILLSTNLGFLVISAPSGTQVDEALFFHRKLLSQGLKPLGIIVNRTHEALPDSVFASADVPQAAIEAGREYNALVALEQSEITRLQAATGEATPVVTVRELEEDVHDIAGLLLLGQGVFGAGGRTVS